MPSASLQTLERADGSATYSSNGFSIVGAVNGPVEVQRRDEIPDEAAIDVVIRPAAGVGGTSGTLMHTDQDILTATFKACENDIWNRSFIAHFAE